MLQRVELIPHRIYDKLCKDQSIIIFKAYIFQSSTRSRENISVKTWWNLMKFEKLDPLVQIYDQSNEKNLIRVLYLI